MLRLLLILLIGGAFACHHAPEGHQAPSEVIPVQINDFLITDLFEEEMEQWALNVTCQMQQQLIGDLNGDSLPDLLLHYTCESDSLPTPQGWLIYLQKNGQMKRVMHYPQFQAIPESIEDGKIHLFTLQYAPQDAPCCPSLKNPRVAQLKGADLQMIDHDFVHLLQGLWETDARVLHFQNKRVSISGMQEAFPYSIEGNTLSIFLPDSVLSYQILRITERDLVLRNAQKVKSVFRKMKQRVSD